MTDRYQAHGIEAEFELGSRERVLRNLLGITRVRDMQAAESQALHLAQTRAIETVSDNQRFTAVDICRLHRLWLSPIYAWAGEYRTVNLGKGGVSVCQCSVDPGIDGRAGAQGIATVHAVFSGTR